MLHNDRDTSEISAAFWGRRCSARRSHIDNIEKYLVTVISRTAMADSFGYPRVAVYKKITHQLQIFLKHRHLLKSTLSAHFVVVREAIDLFNGEPLTKMDPDDYMGRRM